MKVLVAEDEAFSRLLLTKTLTQLGYEAVAVTTGDEALAMLSQPDGPLIGILDGYLPGDDGVTICKKVRALTPLPFRYLLMLTAKADLNHRVQALEAGADAFLAKPFDLKELAAYLCVARRQVDYYQKLMK